LCFCICPDIRANENPSLAAVHTLFIREHNRLAGRVAAANPTWTDDQIFQAARRYVIALLQHITYDEYLPALLGSPLPGYTGYKAGVNPTIATEFSTVGFRVGHSMVNSDQKFMDDNGNEVAQVCACVCACGWSACAHALPKCPSLTALLCFVVPLVVGSALQELSLRDAFFNIAPLTTLGVDPIIKYLATDRSQEVDTVRATTALHTRTHHHHHVSLGRPSRGTCP
jgi:hypothetical protein